MKSIDAAAAHALDNIAKSTGHNRDAVRAVLQETSGRDGTGFGMAMGRCESPIEQAYCLVLFQVFGVFAVDGEFGPQVLEMPESRRSSRSILVFSQQPLPPYRADFLLVGISATSAEPIFVIVECDGADYHSTREQKRRDADRQKALENTGFRVIRFSGSEIHTNLGRSLGGRSWNSTNTAGSRIC